MSTESDKSEVNTAPQGDTPGVNQDYTYGQTAVGLDFNMAEGATHDAVHTAKQKCADLIDMAESTRTPSDSRFKNTIITMAVTATLAAQMAVVKVLTWKKS